MTTQQQLSAIVAGTASILSLQLLILNNSQSHSFKHSIASRVLGSILALPASAESNSASVLSVGTHSIATQETSFAKQYKPPLERNPKRSEGSGSRGCDESLPENLVTLLIPSKEYAGQTTLGHPTFFWHLSKPVSVPVRFVLVEPNVEKPLLEKILDSPKVGINQIETPKNLPELVPGRLYKWSVSLLCNPKRPSENPYFYSWIQRQPATPDLTQKLATVTNDRDRARIYAQAGQWYDALATMSTAFSANPNNNSIREDFLSLLNQVGLTQVAEKERQKLSKQ